MDMLFVLITQSLLKVWETFLHNWPFLLASVLIAVGLKLYLKPEKITAFLIRHQGAGVVGATIAAVATPLCSCGSTAVILGMMASTIPWAPIVAFMVASPLTSPEGVIYNAGLFGWPFALIFYAASILLGLLGGLSAGWMEKRGWLANQSRFGATRPADGAARLAPAPASCGPACAASAASTLPTAFSPAVLSPSAGCACDQAAPALVMPVQTCCDANPGYAAAAPALALTAAQGRSRSSLPSIDLKQFLSETWQTGRKLLVMFSGFAFIGYFLNGLIPSEWVSALFGGQAPYSVPLAALLGLPLYLNSEASMPLVRAMIDNGMSQGAALAFLITGAGTSIGALGGALTIARWRVVALVIAVLVAGAVLTGYLFNAMIALGWV